MGGVATGINRTIFVGCHLDRNALVIMYWENAALVMARIGLQLSSSARSENAAEKN